MDPVTGAAMITGGAGMAGSALSFYGQERANKQNLAIAREQMAFQESMFRNRHQMEVADLRAAGLNPILSATKGQGGSAPSGASIAMQNPFQNLGLERTASSAFEAANRAKDLKAKTEAIKKTEQDTRTSGAMERKDNNQANLIKVQKDIADINKKAAEAALPAAKAKAYYETEKAKVQSNPILMWTNEITNAIGGGIGSIIGGIRQGLTGAKNVKRRMDSKKNSFKGAQERSRQLRRNYRTNRNSPF